MCKHVKELLVCSSHKKANIFYLKEISTERDFVNTTEILYSTANNVVLYTFECRVGNFHSKTPNNNNL